MKIIYALIALFLAFPAKAQDPVKGIDPLRLVSRERDRDYKIEEKRAYQSRFIKEGFFARLPVFSWRDVTIGLSAYDVLYYTDVSHGWLSGEIFQLEGLWRERFSEKMRFSFVPGLSVESAPYQGVLKEYVPTDSTIQNSTVMFAAPRASQWEFSSTNSVGLASHTIFFSSAGKAYSTSSRGADFTLKGSVACLNYYSASGETCYTLLQDDRGQAFIRQESGIYKGLIMRVLLKFRGDPLGLVRLAMAL